MASQIEIKLKRGTAGQPERVKKVIKGLGLRRPGHKVVREDSPSIRGMIFKIIHCVEVKLL